MRSQRRRFLRTPGMIKEENAMRVKAQPTRIELSNQVLRAEIASPTDPIGWLVVPKLAHESKYARLDAATLRNLNALGLGTLLVTLPQRNAPVRMTADWLHGATQWLQAQPEARDLPLGFLSTGQATVPTLVTASMSGAAFVLSWNGMPSRAWQHLHQVTVPTLMMVGENSPWRVWLSNWLTHWFLNGQSEFRAMPGTQPRFDYLADWYNRRVVNQAIETKITAPRSLPKWAQRGLTTAMLLGVLGTPLSLFASPAMAATDPTAKTSTYQVAKVQNESSSSEFSDGVTISAAKVKGDGMGSTQVSATAKQPGTGLGSEFSDSVIIGGSQVRGDGQLPPKQAGGPIKTKKNGRKNPKATGSQALVDNAGVKYFVNTNITFSTSSSASGAMSEASFQNAVPAYTSGGGVVNSTLNDAYDGYNTICISLNNTVATCQTGNANFEIYNKNGPAPLEGNGRQIDFTVENFGNIAVSRKVFIPSNDSFARWLNIFKNNGSTPQTVTMVVSTNLGSDSNTRVVTSSNGNSTAEVADTWITSFQNWSGTTSSDPRLGHVLQGAGTVTAPVAGINFVNGDDNPYWGYTFTLQPGQTGIIMDFAVVQPTKAAAATKSAQLVGLPTNALQFMSDAEKNQVLNFQVFTHVPGPAPIVPSEVPEGDTLLLLGGGLSGVGVWLSYEWNKRRKTQ